MNETVDTNKEKDKDIVSVIIRTYPERPDVFLMEAIHSVIKQDYKNIQLIISSDGERKISPKLSELLQVAKDQLHEVIILQNQKQGRSYGGNQGLAVATGKYINFLDDDDYFYPIHITSLLNVFWNTNDVDAVYACTHLKYYKFKKGAIVEISSVNFLEGAAKFSMARLACQSFTPMQTVMFKRELYEKHGGFDTSMEGAEDWDLWNRYLSGGKVKGIDVFTSAIRQVSDLRKLMQRSKDIKKYHAKLRENQKNIYVTLNLAEIAECFEEIITHKNESKFSKYFNFCTFVQNSYQNFSYVIFIMRSIKYEIMHFFKRIILFRF